MSIILQRRKFYEEQIKKIHGDSRLSNNVWHILLNFPSNTFKSFTASAADELTVVIDNGSTIILRDKDNNGYYDIGTADELYAFAAIVNGSNNIINAELTGNITVNDSVLNEDGTLNTNDADKFRTWMPIGFCYDINHDDLPEIVYYKGLFDGNGHTISGLYLNNKEQRDVGLFGKISEEAEIRNVGVINSYFYGDYRIGGICGSNYGTIINSYNSSIVKSDDIAIGGVCGYNLNMITNCCYDKDKYTGNGVENNSGENIGKTTAEFKSGEIAFLLSQGKKGSVWCQLIGTNDYPVLDSTKRVYRNVTYTGCSEAYKGDLNYVYSNTEIINPIYREHDYASGGVCKNCDALKNGKDGFKSASITLTDGVIMNYYMILSHEALDDKEAYIHFTSEQGIDEKIKLSKGSEVDGKYKFSFKLSPDQMSDEITAKVVYGDTTEGSDITYSVKQYAENLSQNEKVLADAMLKFGAFAQKYTGNNIDNLAADVTDYTENAIIGDEYKHSFEGEIDGIKVKGATLLIGANTTIRVKYQLDEGENIEDYTFKCDGIAIEPVKSGGYCYVYLKNICPQDLDTMHNFTVTKGETEKTLKYSAFSYMKNILDNAESYADNQNLINLINAMYEYNQAAEAYNG